MTPVVRFARAQDPVARAEVVGISGTVPTGVPVGTLGELVRLASGAGRQSVIDPSGQPLIDALRARPTTAELTGDRDAQRAARSLADSGVATCP
jgi:tagatose 6-phosphate kinase